MGPPIGPVTRSIRALDDALGHFEHALLVLFLGMLIGTGVYQSVASHVFSINETWPFEIIRYSVFFIAMTGAALAAKRGQMISMDFVTRLVSPRTRQVIQIGIACFVVGVCVLLCLAGFRVRSAAVQLNESHEIISPAIALLALPLAAILIALHTLLHAAISCARLASGAPDAIATPTD